jgi:hypothetical protein
MFLLRHKIRAMLIVSFLKKSNLTNPTGAEEILSEAKWSGKAPGKLRKSAGEEPQVLFYGGQIDSC